jgi:hypothetical protein
MELLPAVLEIVGVPVSSVKDTDTLASLGMDSLQLSEVKLLVPRCSVVILPQSEPHNTQAVGQV